MDNTNRINVGKPERINLKTVCLSDETHKSLMLIKAKFNFKTVDALIVWLLKERGLWEIESGPEKTQKVHPSQLKGAEKMTFRDIS